MKIIISVVGIKGGNGKSTTSQTLAFGIAKLGHFSFLMSTDPRRREGREIQDNRGYINLDGRTENGSVERISDFLAFDEGNELAVLVIDGGANESRELDKSLAEISDIVLIPFMRSPDDLDSAKIELTVHENAYGLPNRWPTNVMSLQKANKYLETHLSEFTKRILRPNFDCNATIDLLGDADSITASTLNSVAKKLATQVLEVVNVNVNDKEFPKNA